MKQPQDCGRSHPQPLCMCVLCELAMRFSRIESLQKQYERIQQFKKDIEIWNARHGGES